MAHSYRNDGPGGLAHVVLGVGIVIAIGLYTQYGDAIAREVGAGRSVPSILSTQGSKSAGCKTRSVDTILGTIGCEGSRKAAHLSKTTLVSHGTTN